MQQWLRQLLPQGVGLRAAVGPCRATAELKLLLHNPLHHCWSGLLLKLLLP